MVCLMFASYHAAMLCRRLPWLTDWCGCLVWIKKVLSNRGEKVKS